MKLYVARAVRSDDDGAEIARPRGVLVEHGRISALVDVDDRLARRSLAGVETDDLGDAVLVPGFVDAHNHQPTAARDVGTVRTAHATSLAELQTTLRDAAARTPRGSWVVTEHSLTVSQLGMLRLPCAADLDAAVPHHPCAVRFGAHTMVLNTRALAASGVTALAADPPDGVVDRDEVSGAPTGPLHEYGAIQLVLRHLVDTSDPVARMRLVQAEYACAGLTTVRVPGLRPGDLGVYQRLLEDDGRLATRVVGGPRLDPTASHAEKLAVIAGWEAVTGFGSEWLRLDAVKVFVDGGVETALVGDQHRFLAADEVRELVAAAAARGWSVSCHAVTPDAVEIALDAFAAAAGLRAPSSRMVVEHGFFATRAQLSRAARLGVWLSTQPAIAQVEDRLIATAGSDSRGGARFPLASALRAGVRCALGSDWNATPGSTLRPFLPLETIRIATGRHARGGLAEAETVDVATALRLHTRAAAELAGCSDRGAIRPGMLADFTLLSCDPAIDLAACTVVGVVVGGRRRGT